MQLFWAWETQCLRTAGRELDWAYQVQYIGFQVSSKESRLMVHYMVRKQSMIRSTWEPQQLFHIWGSVRSGCTTWWGNRGIQARNTETPSIYHKTTIGFQWYWYCSVIKNQNLNPIVVKGYRPPLFLFADVEFIQCFTGARFPRIISFTQEST